MGKSRKIFEKDYEVRDDGLRTSGKIRDRSLKMKSSNVGGEEVERLIHPFLLARRKMLSNCLLVGDSTIVTYYHFQKLICLEVVYF